LKAPISPTHAPTAPSPVSATILLGIATLAFLAVAAAMVSGLTRGFDEGLILMLRRPGDITRPVGPHWLAMAVTDLTGLGSIAILTVVVLGAVGLLVARKRSREAAMLFCASGSGLILLNILKVVFGRPRPPVAMHVVEVGNSSFPSGHAMLSAIVYLSLAMVFARGAEGESEGRFAVAAGVLVTLMVGVSRVYLGVHWPTDVIAGWALGAAWAMLWSLIAGFVANRRGASLEGPNP
jgi:undecaprenyl-diphosphatase